jgi:hypothetical protein
MCPQYRALWEKLDSAKERVGEDVQDKWEGKRKA